MPLSFFIKPKNLTLPSQCTFVLSGPLVFFFYHNSPLANYNASLFHHADSMKHPSRPMSHEVVPCSITILHCSFAMIYCSTTMPITPSQFLTISSQCSGSLHNVPPPYHYIPWSHHNASLSSQCATIPIPYCTI